MIPARLRPKHRKRGPSVSAPLEKTVQWEIVQALRLLGFDVSSFSQPRASMQTEGIPDLYARHEAWGLRIWIECKRPGGKLSFEQQAWHAAERAAGGIVLVATGATDAVEQIARLREPK
jgi:hypothetical protein